MSAARDHWMHRTGGSLYSDAAFVAPADKADRSQDAARDERFAVKRIALNVKPPPAKRKHRRTSMSVDLYLAAVEVRREESK